MNWSKKLSPCAEVINFHSSVPELAVSESLESSELLEVAEVREVEASESSEPELAEVCP